MSAEAVKSQKVVISSKSGSISSSNVSTFKQVSVSSSSSSSSSQSVKTSCQKQEINGAPTYKVTKVQVTASKPLPLVGNAQISVTTTTTKKTSSNGGVTAAVAKKKVQSKTLEESKVINVKQAVENCALKQSKSGSALTEEVGIKPSIECVEWKSNPDLGIWSDFKPSIWSGRVLKLVTEIGSGDISTSLSADAAKSFVEATDKDRKELQQLNDRLGNYIDRVKHLEEQNHQLVADLDELKSQWGTHSNELKVKSFDDLVSVRKDTDTALRSKAESDVKIARLNDDIAEFKSRIEYIQSTHTEDKENIKKSSKELKGVQSELELIRSRYKELIDEEKSLNDESTKLWADLEIARNEYNEESINLLYFQHQVESLTEEVQVRKRIHEQEVTELQSLLDQAPFDTKEFFKNELALTIREITQEYELLAKQGKEQMESWYKLKLSELQTSTNKSVLEFDVHSQEVTSVQGKIDELQSKLEVLAKKNSSLEKEVHTLNQQLGDRYKQYESDIEEREATLRLMNSECSTLVSELQSLLDTNQILDAEIAIYRKMLEGEESRVGKVVIKQVESTHSTEGELSSKTTFQRSSKGNVTIAECHLNGKYITLENTHQSDDEDLGGYELHRKLDGNQDDVAYTIPANVILHCGKTLKIYAKDQGGVHNLPETLVAEDLLTWGTAANVQTTLLNKDGVECATYTQKTIQTGQ